MLGLRMMGSVALVPAALPDISGLTNATGLQQILAKANHPRSVAIVGSSGNLLHRGFGAEIDRHDVVVRINGATTAGYEHDVGKARNQFVVCFSVGCADAFKRRQFAGGALAIVTSPYLGKPNLPSEVAGKGVRAAYIKQSWMQAMHAVLKEHGDGGQWPSTG